MWQEQYQNSRMEVTARPINQFVCAQSVREREGEREGRVVGRCVGAHVRGRRLSSGTDGYGHKRSPMNFGRLSRKMTNFGKYYTYVQQIIMFLCFGTGAVQQIANASRAQKFNPQNVNGVQQWRPILAIITQMFNKSSCFVFFDRSSATNSKRIEGPKTQP